MSNRDNLDRSLARHANPPAEQVESAVARVGGILASEARGNMETASFGFPEDMPVRKSRSMALIAAAALLVVGLISAGIIRNVSRFDGPTAIVESAGDNLLRVDGENSYPIAAGERIATGETVRSKGGAVVVLKDQSRIEMRSGAEFTLESAGDGTRIRLNRGSIIVKAAKQVDRHLYVQTRDLMVSVVGTVFLVNAEETGSRVAVIEGKVRVLQGSIETTLTSGEEAATTEELKLRSLLEEISLSSELETYRASLVQPVPIPPVRAALRGEVLRFDVASLKVEDRPDKATVTEIQGLSCTGKDGAWQATMASTVTTFAAPRGRCIARYSGIQILLAALNDVPSDRVAGAPNWRSVGSPYEFGFNIEAVAEDPANVTTAELRQMLKAFLIERFKLKTHLDRREQDGYALMVSSDGPKIRPAMQSDIVLPIVEEQPRLEIIKGRTSMKTLAEYLSRTRCTVVDKTGLDGIYDYALSLKLALVGVAINDPDKLTGPNGAEVEKKKVAESRGVITMPRNCGPPRGRDRVFEYNPSLNSALQQQLGLRLDAQKVFVDYIVIDEISEPTQN